MNIVIQLIYVDVHIFTLFVFLVLGTAYFWKAWTIHLYESFFFGCSAAYIVAFMGPVLEWTVISHCLWLSVEKS